MNGDSAGGRPFIRWRYLVKPSLQFRFMFVVLLALMGVLFLGWNAYFTMGTRIFGEMVNPRAMELFRGLNLILLYRLAIYVVLTVLLALFLSHKVAGPLHNIERSAREIGKGRLRYKIHLRRFDELQDLQDELNAMTQSLHDKVAADRLRRDKIFQKIQEIRREIPTPKPEIERGLAEMESLLSELTREFDV